MDQRDLRILQMVGANSVCTIFEYYKLGLSMGVPHDVLTRNATKVDQMEMLVAAPQMNSQLDVPNFFVTTLTGVCPWTCDRPMKIKGSCSLWTCLWIWMIDNLLHRWKEDRLFSRMLCLALHQFSVLWII